MSARPNWLNRAAQGLLGFFDIKSDGQNPAALSLSLSPVLDVRDFYLMPYATALGAPVNVAAVGGALDASGVLTVPQGRVWIVKQALAFTSGAIGAGVTLSGRVAVYDSQGSYVLLGEQSASRTTGQLLTTTIGDPALWFLMTAGMQLGFFCDSLVGGPQQVQIAVRRLEVPA